MVINYLKADWFTLPETLTTSNIPIKINNVKYHILKRSNEIKCGHKRLKS